MGNRKDRKKSAKKQTTYISSQNENGEKIRWVENIGHQLIKSMTIQCGMFSQTSIHCGICDEFFTTDGFFDMYDASYTLKDATIIRNLLHSKFSSIVADAIWDYFYEQIMIPCCCKKTCVNILNELVCVPLKKFENKFYEQ